MTHCQLAGAHLDTSTRPRRLAGFTLILALLAAAPAAAQEASGTTEDATSETTTADSDASDEAKNEASEVAEAPPTDKSDTPEAMQGGSGVRVQQICTNCNQASLTINGVTGSDHVLVSWDGVPAVGGLGTVYHTILTPPEMVGYSHVLRGPGSVLSGSGGMGGVLEFHSAPRTTDETAVLDFRASDYGAQSLKVGGTDRWGPVGALVLVQEARGNEVDGSGDGYNELPKFERLTAHGIFDFHLNDDHVITLGGMFFGEDQFNGPGAPFRPTNSYLEEDVFFNWRQFTLGWEGQLPGGVRMNFTSSYSRRFQQQVAPPTPVAEPIDYQHVEDERSSFRLEARVPAGKAGMITSGIAWSNLRVLFENFESSNPRVNDGIEHWELYSQYERSIGSKWSVSAGGRYDDLLVYGEATANFGQQPPPDAHLPSSWFLPRAQAVYRPSQKLSFSLATGRFVVGPTPIAERICCGAKLSRSISIKPERAWSHQAQVELHPTPDMRFTITLFRTDFKDYIQRDVKSSNFAIPTYELNNVPGARVEGIDLIHDMRFKGNVFNVGWTYSYSDSSDQDGHWLPFLPRTTAGAYFRYDQPRRGTKLGLSLSYQGPLRHYALDAYRSPRERPPVGWMKSEDYVTGDFTAEQAVGKKGWAIVAGINNLADYVQGDLTDEDANGNDIMDKFERAYDWGPLQGRVIYAGVRFAH